MKKLYQSFLAVALTLISSICLVSCIEVGHSPTITYNNVTINGKPAAGQVNDTLHLGDTLRMYLRCDGYDNHLQFLQIDIDREYFRDSLLADNLVDKYFTPSSKPESGYYQFKDAYAFASYWSLIVIKEPAVPMKQFEVYMTLQSDRELDDQFNPTHFFFNVNAGQKEATPQAPKTE